MWETKRRENIDGSFSGATMVFKGAREKEKVHWKAFSGSMDKRDCRRFDYFVFSLSELTQDF